MATNDFIPFAAAGGANVETQSNYASASSTSTGFVAGICPSKNFNKALRQATLVAAATTDVLKNAGVTVADNGTTATITAELDRYIGATGHGFVHSGYSAYSMTAWDMNQQMWLFNAPSGTPAPFTVTYLSLAFTRLVKNQTLSDITLSDAGASNTIVIPAGQTWVVWYLGGVIGGIPADRKGTIYFNARPSTPVEGDEVIYQTGANFSLIRANSYTYTGDAGVGHGGGLGISTNFITREIYHSGNWIPTSFVLYDWQDN